MPATAAPVVPSRRRTGSIWCGWRIESSLRGAKRRSNPFGPHYGLVRFARNDEMVQLPRNPLQHLPEQVLAIGDVLVPVIRGAVVGRVRGGLDRAPWHAVALADMGNRKQFHV